MRRLASFRLWQSPTARRPWWRPVLSLADQIILINFVAMLLMLGGLFYFGHYMDRFIAAEVDTLTNQARLIAGTLSEVAIENTPDGDTLRVDATRQIVRRLMDAPGVRAQVFAPGRLLVADSRLLMGAGRYVQITQLDPPKSMTRHHFSWAVGAMDWLITLLPYQRNLPVYEDTALPGVGQTPDVMSALRGDAHWTVWNTPNKQLVLTVAVPVQRVRQVVGAVMLSRDSEQISSAIRQLRRDLLQSFAIVMAMSLVLSLYLARTIALPLRHLARAATGAEVIAGDRPDIPDFTRRQDEVGDLSAALRGMTTALWQRLGAIERFAADVSHELKNPLTSMHSAVETLGRVQDDEQRQKLLAIVREDVRRMERLITDIAAVSRLEGELARTTPERVDLADFSEALVANRAQTGSPVIFTRMGKSHVILGIPGQLAQVLENLIANALSFSPPDRPVQVTVSEAGKHVRLLVEDDGPGIPYGKEEKIFERFYSERPENEQFGTHSGLGLNICRQIVEGQGGRIWAENREKQGEPPRGARFIVELPRIQDK